jgi:hypothetical protein
MFSYLYSQREIVLIEQNLSRQKVLANYNYSKIPSIAKDQLQKNITDFLSNPMFYVPEGDEDVTDDNYVSGTAQNNVIEKLKVKKRFSDSIIRVDDELFITSHSAMFIVLSIILDELNSDIILDHKINEYTKLVKNVSLIDINFHETDLIEKKYNRNTNMAFEIAGYGLLYKAIRFLKR